MIVAPAAYTTTTQFVTIASSIRVPALKTLLIMLLTSLNLSKTFSLAVNDILSSLINVTDTMARSSVQVDIRQLQIVQKVGT